MQQLSKDYKLMLLAILIATIIGVVLLQLPVIMNSLSFWQIALGGTITFIICMIIQLFMQAQKLQHKK